MATDTDGVTVTVNPLPTVTFTAVGPFCVSGSAVDLSGSVSPAGGTFSGPGVSGNTFDPVAAGTGTHLITYSFTDGNGCSNSASRNITVNSSPTATVSGDATISAGGSATISAALAGTAPWSITWSDGATQSGIAGSPATRDVSPASTTTYTVTAVSDANCTGTFSGSATVTVNPPPGGGEEVVLATNSVWLKEGSDVLSGSVIVNNASSGPVLDSQVELAVGQNVTTPAGFALKANRIKVKQGAVVASDIFYNTLENNGTINGSENSPLTLPVLASLPPFIQAPPGIQDITVVSGGSITLTAGAYRDIFVKQNGVILFTGGGTFALRSLNTGAKVKLLFDAPTEILIEGKFDTDENSYVGPQEGSGIGAADIVFYVAGSNGNNGNFGATPKAAQLGLKNTVLANFYVPNGTLWLREGTVATGAFLGKDVIVGEHVQVTLESAFASGNSLAKSADNESGQEKLISAAIPEVFALLQNYPNPFNPSTTINFVLPTAGRVMLQIFNETGQLVRTLAEGEMNTGSYAISWDGRNQTGATVASGVYFYRLVARKASGEVAFTETKRMVFVQ